MASDWARASKEAWMQHNDRLAQEDRGGTAAAATAAAPLLPPLLCQDFIKPSARHLPNVTVFCNAPTGWNPGRRARPRNWGPCMKPSLGTSFSCKLKT